MIYLNKKLKVHPPTMGENDMFREKYGLAEPFPETTRREIDWIKIFAVILGLILIAIGTYLA